MTLENRIKQLEGSELPFVALEVYDSFVIPFNESHSSNGKEYHNLMNRVQPLKKTAEVLYSAKYKTICVDDGILVIRIK
jgi:hypothetical protein